MPQCTFVQNGCAIDYTPVADVAPGDVVVQGDLVGVAVREIKAGEAGALAVEGVFELPKTAGAGSAIAAGTIVFWDATNSVATASDGGGANKLIGKTVLAAADADETVRARLNQ